MRARCTATAWSAYTAHSPSDVCEVERFTTARVTAKSTKHEHRICGLRAHLQNTSLPTHAPPTQPTPLHDYRQVMDCFQLGPLERLHVCCGK